MYKMALAFTSTIKIDDFFVFLPTQNPESPLHPQPCYVGGSVKHKKQCFAVEIKVKTIQNMEQFYISVPTALLIGSSWEEGDRPNSS